MNSMRTGRSVTRKGFSLRGLVLLAAGPPILLILCLLVLGVYEKRAADQVQAEMARLRGLGQPTDDESLQRWFLENTSREGTRNWYEILRLADAGTATFGNVDRLPYVGGAEVPAVLSAETDWPAEEVAEYLRRMRPVIERVHAAIESGVPVWQPIEFQGFQTTLEGLQAARQIIRLLQLEFADAFYHGEGERALRALESMQGVATAFDWQFCMVCEFVQIAFRELHQTMVRTSLSSGMWDTDQVRRLAAQVGTPRDIPRRWQDVIAGERAMVLASIKNSDMWESRAEQSVSYLPSWRLRLLERYREMAAIAAGGLDPLTRRAAQLERAWSTEKPTAFLLLPGRMMQTFLPAVEGFAEAMGREETSRRLTQTALAIKRFQLEEGHWPEDLAELKQLGLNGNDCQTVAGGRFRYEVANDGAYVWSDSLHRDSRPFMIGDENAEKSAVRTMIR